MIQKTGEQEALCLINYIYLVLLTYEAVGSDFENRKTRTRQFIDMKISNFTSEYFLMNLLALCERGRV